MSPPQLPPPSSILLTLTTFLFLLLTGLTSATNNSTVIVKGSFPILSEKGTFQLGFFNTTADSNYYLAIRYTSVPTPTYVWVANRANPTKNLATSSLQLTDSGLLAVKETENLTVWQSTSTNLGFATAFRFLDNGNLVLLTRDGRVLWQSFDFPTDTWLPGMNLTKDRFLTSWRSLSDPSPGFYSLRLKPPDYGEFELVYNATQIYWTSGKWTGQAFTNVPEMTVPYLYRFRFLNPSTPAASFGFTLRPLDIGLGPTLTRFKMELTGQLKQYTWSQQAESWNAFWLQPQQESVCRVYGLCGSFALCDSGNPKPCECLPGFKPVDTAEWSSDEFTGGCRRESGSGSSCDMNDGFESVGFVTFDGDETRSFSGDRRSCKKGCLDNCSCFGFSYNQRSSLCKNMYGSMLNVRNSSGNLGGEDEFYLRIARGGGGDQAKRNKRLRLVVLVVGIVGSVLVLGFIGMVGLVLIRRRKERKGTEEDGGFPVLNLRVFSYKELHSATRGFSEKIGHGGFGAVFHGELSDSIIIAVKRLERPGGGEREFKAEVSTIGNIQHVNLVRLRGFCSENSHRLLVYDYMPNGPLSVYLRREEPNLSWDARFRIAVGMARGIAYLHEECRDCIIHCDIKPENVLLDSEYTAKVSDFGLAKLIDRDYSRVLATMRGTLGYVAPEWISGVEITTKADVYSYGMTLLELIGGRRNVEAPQSVGAKEGGGGGGGAGEKWFFPPWAAQQIIEGNVAAVVDNWLGNAYNIEEAKRVSLVAVWCIQDDEAMRPTMGMVVKLLEGVVEVNVPPPPKLLQALVSGESFCGVRVDSGNGVSTGGGFYGDNMAVSNGGSESSPGDVSSPVNKNKNENGLTKQRFSEVD